MLGIDQIVVGIGKDRLALLRASPLGRRIRCCDELRRDWRRLAVRGIIEGFKILPHRASRRRGIDIFVPLRTWLRAALVGIGLDEAGVDGETFPAHQARSDTSCDHAFEHNAEHIAVAEAFVTGTRECRVIGNFVFDAKPTEPAIREIDLNLADELSFGSDREDVAEDEHPDQEFRIDRRPAGVGIVRRKFNVQPTQVENSCDAAHQMVLRNGIIEIERIKQLRLAMLPTSHHRSSPSLPLADERNHGSQTLSTMSFATQSAPSRLFEVYAVAVGLVRNAEKADIDRMIKSLAHSSGDHVRSSPASGWDDFFH
ncbi:protein of unknown function [Hyphomicrobium sp. MC1]|nr:protein of unknown function [Hyphomicrobium sp. MC1]